MTGLRVTGNETHAGVDPEIEEGGGGGGTHRVGLRWPFGARIARIYLLQSIAVPFENSVTRVFA